MTSFVKLFKREFFWRSTSNDTSGNSCLRIRAEYHDAYERRVTRQGDHDERDQRRERNPFNCAMLDGNLSHASEIYPRLDSTRRSRDVRIYARKARADDVRGSGERRKRQISRRALPEKLGRKYRRANASRSSTLYTKKMACYEITSMTTMSSPVLRLPYRPSVVRVS